MLKETLVSMGTSVRVNDDVTSPSVCTSVFIFVNVTLTLVLRQYEIFSSMGVIKKLNVLIGRVIK